MFLRNLNWHFIGLQTVSTVIFLKIAAIVLLHSIPEQVIFLTGEILVTLWVLFFLRTKIRGSCQSLEMYLGGCLGLWLVLQKFDLPAFIVAFVAIWLLEQNEAPSEGFTKKDLLVTSSCLMVCCGLALGLFGVQSERWILFALVGWAFQLTNHLSKPFEWKTSASGGLWYPVQKHNPNLWIVFFGFANLGLLALTVLNGSFNFGLILVLGKIVQQDRMGRWISVTRAIAIVLVVLPEILRNLLQFLLQYY